MEFIFLCIETSDMCHREDNCNNQKMVYKTCRVYYIVNFIRILFKAKLFYFDYKF